MSTYCGWVEAVLLCTKAQDSQGVHLILQDQGSGLTYVVGSGMVQLIVEDSVGGQAQCCRPCVALYLFYVWGIWGELTKLWLTIVGFIVSVTSDDRGKAKE